MTQEFNHKYLGFGRVPSECVVKMFNDDGEAYICFIDIGKGTSVTNASEQLASEIVNQFSLAPDDCQFFEVYEYNDSFDEIEYTWTSKGGVWKADGPEWKLGDNKIKDLFIK